ncbi:protein CHUP1, chloroplastic [Impatiens glandulifera]|uniref:protein CHUP1, chloroplastic n=1 Tax=Impatiens glandulifera TaxID=253017 RepID=UPI001FB10F2F|nr:protein CHUP1, chloroplastic [Impatiens glandulifera]
MAKWDFGQSSREKTAILKLGIPLAVSIGAFIYAKIHCCEKKTVLDATHQETPAESGEENGKGDIQIRFLQYCNVKEKETALMDMKHSLLSQMAKVEFLNREVLYMEAEAQRLEQVLSKYLKKLEEVESLQTENGFLHMKIAKISTKHNRCSVIVREQKLLVEAGKTEISRNQVELQEKENIIRTLEEEIREFKIVIENCSEVDDEGRMVLSMEDYNKLQMESAEEAKEVVRLRWANACLRHQLSRKKDEQTTNRDEMGISHDSKKKKIVHRFKKWGEKMRVI